MKPDYPKLAVQLGSLLGLAQGATLKVAHLTRQGLEFVFESETTRTEVRLLPRVYTEGKVIVDAINDLTLVVEVRQFPRDPAPGPRAEPERAPAPGGGRIELPFSTWYEEGEYL